MGLAIIGGEIRKIGLHTKDTKINQSIMHFKGGLAEPLFGDLNERAWTFRVVGEGRNERFWRRFIEALRSVSYDGVLGIEHENPFESTDEGILQAVRYLNRLLAPA
jgi:sugar phosphate isomerase/epimerase